MFEGGFRRNGDGTARQSLQHGLLGGYVGAGGEGRLQGRLGSSRQGGRGFAGRLVGLEAGHDGLHVSFAFLRGQTKIRQMFLFPAIRMDLFRCSTDSFRSRNRKLQLYCS